TGVGSRDISARGHRPRRAPSIEEGDVMTRYRTVDLLVTVLIGAAFGVAFLGYGQLYTLIGPLTAAFKPAEGLLAGIWFLPAVLAALLVRRPGAALLAGLLAAVMSMLLGSQW